MTIMWPGAPGAPIDPSIPGRPGFPRTPCAPISNWSGFFHCFQIKQTIIVTNQIDEEKIVYHIPYRRSTETA